MASPQGPGNAGDRGRASREDKRYATVVAFFAAGLFLACVVAAFGMISLYTGREVITESDAGPFVGPIVCVAATLALLGLLVAHGRSVSEERQRIAPGAAIGSAVAVYAVFVIGGGVVYAMATGHALGVLTFSFAMAGSWFAISLSVVAFVVALSYQLVLVGRFRQRGRPRWPWEHNDDL